MHTNSAITFITVKGVVKGSVLGIDSWSSGRHSPGMARKLIVECPGVNCHVRAWVVKVDHYS